jgi:hypothetical protein
VKKWWRKSPGELWLDLFAREKTRWIAVVLFLALAVFVNWRVVDAALTGEAFTRFGRAVRSDSDSVSFTALFIWSVVAAVIIDSIVIGAAIFVYRESKKEKSRTSR